MIDHVSISVSDLDRSAAFYQAVLAQLGMEKLAEKPGTVGFGKKYPEFWLNFREDLEPLSANSGRHICLRAQSTEEVDRFWQSATKLGAADEGAPGLRPEYTAQYYAAFIRDFDGNSIEAVTFVS